MRRPASLPLIFIFGLLTFTVIYSAGCNYILHGISKGLLMPVLASILLYNHPAPGRNMIISGLFFSWAGDVLLLFEDRGAIFFIGGLVSFLTTHIFYIVYFLSIRSPRVSLIKQKPWLVLLVVMYGAGLVFFLFPYLGDMKLPVTVYATVICTMMACSLHAFNKVNSAANSMFVSGALLFAISDSLLAVNKFYQSFSSAGLLIIVTYCAAQLLIVIGSIKRKVL